jgi:hypothetical protein
LLVYNLALARAKRNGFSALSGEGVHAQLWRLFVSSPEPQCSYLGEIGNRLKFTRQKADYDSVFVRIEEVVPDVISAAIEFAERLGRLAPRHPDPRSVRH